MFEAEVAAGAAWLDEVSPGWETRIDLAGLDMSSCSECILGQMFGTGFDAEVDLGAEPVKHGFDLASRWPDPPPSAEYDALRDTWVALIKERHDSGNLSGTDG